MISAQILQSTIDGLKNITRREMSVIDFEGKVIATTDSTNLGQTLNITNFLESKAESQLIAGEQFFKVFENGICEYVISIKGEDEESYRIGKIAAFQIQSLLTAYKERFNKDNFIKNLLLDNLLLIDIYSRAKKLQIESQSNRIVYLIEYELDNDIDQIEVIKSIFPNGNRDFVVAISENSVVLVHQLCDNDSETDILLPARMIVETLTAEGCENVRAAAGTIVSDIKNVPVSYKEAMLAMEVGKIFNKEQIITNYASLGLGRLIYQLPTSLCKIFLNEVLNGVSLDFFDEETLETVNKFFENNLNVSETSRQLYIHRNTLVYRLDKIYKATGIDLRKFDDAIIFKITMMVNTFLAYKEEHSYF